MENNWTVKHVVSVFESRKNLIHKFHNELQMWPTGGIVRCSCSTKCNNQAIICQKKSTKDSYLILIVI